MGIRSLSAASISAGAKRSKFWDQNTIISNNSYESIATVTVGAGGSSTITFSSIPATFAHLQLRGIGRSTNGDAGGNSVSISFNGNTTYRSHYLYGEGSGTAASGTDTIRNYLTRVPSQNEPANVFGAFICDILDYADTNKFKTGRSLFGFDVSGSGGSMFFSSFLYQSTTAISSLTITIYGGYTFAENTQIALYGIKG